MNLALINQMYKKACTEYVRSFAEKHDLTFEYWVGEIGSIACFQDIYYFNMEDIIYDLNTDQKKGLITKWIEDTVEYQGKGRINFKSYSEGLRYHHLKKG